MLNSHFYPTVFKRKSFHVFLGCGSETISAEELRGVEAAYAAAERALFPDEEDAEQIKVAEYLLQ